MSVLAGTDVLRHAIASARRGWSVLPLHTPIGGACSCGRRDCPAAGKHPRLRWESLMRRTATEAEIVAWWRRWPDANLGIATGVISGIAVLDVDPRHGGDASLAALEERWGRLPDTLEVATGGGGRHLWFSSAGEPVPSAVLGPGLELKAEGGMVVAPPSLHRSGLRYAWVAGHGPADRDPVPLPPWLRSAGDEGRAHADPSGPPPPRTDAERHAFRAAWARAGITLADDDVYYRCPFHPDEHPSLHVDLPGCRWYCFGCRRGGGIGRLLELLGERPPVTPRHRLRACVGSPAPVTIEGDEGLEIVGESHHQDELLALAGRRPYGGVELSAVAELVPEPAHPIDPLAISVRIDGRPVGYLRREDARRLREVVFDARRRHGRATCRAVIRGGWDRGRSNVGSFGVVLLVPAGWRPGESTVPESARGPEPGRDGPGGDTAQRMTRHDLASASSRMRPGHA